jgi:predicted CXXCH cytochrome family protein
MKGMSGVIRTRSAGRSGRILVCLMAAAMLCWAAPQKEKEKTKEAPAGPPADATFVGDDTCAGCHSDLAGAFALSPHGRLKAFELQDAGGRCESCHGPGSKHAEEGGDARFIHGFRNGGSPEAARTCAKCHGDGAALHWNGSEHAASGVQCASCHQIHQSRRLMTPMMRVVAGSNPAGLAAKPAPPPRFSLKKAEPELCYDCHREKRAQMNQMSHHPVREGRMQCSSCHNTHGSAGDHLLRDAESEKAFCTNCHPSKQGPFVFEHAAVEEGCQTCHNPHGSVARRLLKQNEPFLCLQCHEAHFHIGREGQTAALQLPTGGSANPNGLSGWRQAFGTRCTQCHSQIHGSDLPSQSITSRGKALTR